MERGGSSWGETWRIDDDEAVRTMTPTLDLDAIYRRHGQVVLRRARRILADEQEAHEVLQDVFLSLLRDPGQFHAASSITTFLYSATTHRCLNVIRDRKNRVRLVDERVAPAEAASAAPEGETRALARALLARLPEEVAMAAVFAHVDGMTYDEIAQVMGCSRRHVGNLLQRLEGAATGEEDAAC